MATMLIVDDSPDLRAIIRTQFERLGFKVIAEAANGAEAVKLFEQHRPELVTLDVIMPHASGIDALSAFRAMRRINSRARIVILSAVPLSQTCSIFLSEGAFAFIEKPFTRAVLANLRRKLLAAFPELHLVEDNAPPSQRG